MPKLTVEIRTQGRASADVKRRLISRISNITSRAAQRLKDEAVRLMNQPKSGIHHRGLPRRSSAEGEAPASQTGALASSFRVTAQGRHQLHRRVGTGLWYGNFLMTQRNRPLLLPALNKVFPDYVEEIRDMIGREA